MSIQNKSYPLVSPKVLRRMITSIDIVIHNLSDSSDIECTGTRHQARKRKIGEISDRSHSKEHLRRFGIKEQKDDNDILLNSPPGLEVQYLKLCNLLRTGLLGIDGNSRNTDKKRNVSALLMGPRGHGKSLVLERCIATLQRELESSNKKSENKNKRQNPILCRIVRLNGTLLRGNDVALSVREIVRQLSEIAAKESFHKIQSAQQNAQRGIHPNCSPSSDPVKTVPEKSSSVEKTHTVEDSKKVILKESLTQNLLKESYALRIRKGTFNSSLALLDEVLRTALIDSIPILVVLEELDTFLAYSSAPMSNASSNISTNGRQQRLKSVAMAAPPTERHLLLYHLLDRVAGHGSLVSLVGMTSRLSTVSLFEKRVKSRAEGTSKIIYFGHPPRFDVLVEILLSKFCGTESGNLENAKGCTTDKNGLEEYSFNGNSFINDLKSQFRRILLPAQDKPGPLRDDFSLVENAMKNQMPQAVEARRMFERSYDLGRDTRWFCRVISLSLSLFVEDLQRQAVKNRKSSNQTCEIETYDKVRKTKTTNTTFHPNYLLEALIVMGGTTDVKVDCLGAEQKNPDLQGLDSFLPLSTTVSSTSAANEATLYGPFNSDGQYVSPVGWNSTRLQALLDLSGSQVAIMLAAKRVLSRDVQKLDSNTMTPLSYERIEMEYESYKASGPDRYGSHVLYRSFCQLMDTDLLRPARDHAGGCPLQYFYRGKNNPLEVDPIALKRLPLHMNLDLRNELDVALKNRMLDCTTALRDWGLKNQ